METVLGLCRVMGNTIKGGHRMKIFDVNGKLMLDLHTQVEAETEEEAFENVTKKLNTYSVKKFILEVEDSDGRIHKIEINDHELEWEDVEESIPNPFEITVDEDDEE
jgi:hypothetical protein